MALPMRVMKPAMKASMKAAMKASMKKAVMKVMKMKAMKKSIVGSKSRVYNGTKVKTIGGLTKDSLIKNKNGKVVSKKASAASKARYANSKVKDWAMACKAARKALGLTGFVPIGGKTAAGKALYAKAKSLL
mmetsp:Transcript_3848/g.5320  ORF Transcript_3848/g.5320 Transcript_3848/m.5320 type:complete len:132 (-) Transcript_3848:342-737(-)|eukprot:CAMPEP_0194749716 /NCGR_PEP_ID=MMETSP0323_2-20130528/3830_1 /TAXON_ID=2866 ORGANISM="Crypthecodinium cohnii, Strain Seligo" /NCGR_SAMPLE_ID=MMETSP0323_2 /ASSEMBLY_ACC=CAM_ASM_000346 /LENGTH=131 /DNA_ID=CAMNT_0039664937 /DNA_START=77 /DNA_END=472 /DNA_ORIENTATION=+